MADELFHLVKRVDTDVYILKLRVDEAEEEMVKESINVYTEQRLYISNIGHLAALAKLQELKPIFVPSCLLVTRRSEITNAIQMDVFAVGLAKECMVSDEPVRAVDERNQGYFQIIRWLDDQHALENAKAELKKIKNQFKEAAKFSVVPISQPEDLDGTAKLNPHASSTSNSPK